MKNNENRRQNRNEPIYRDTMRLQYLKHCFLKAWYKCAPFSKKRPSWGAPLYRRVLQMHANRVRYYNKLLRNLCVNHDGETTRHVLIYILWLPWSRTCKILRTISCYCSSHGACRYYIVITIVSDKNIINRII